jgi:hypothetical protein
MDHLIIPIISADSIPEPKVWVDIDVMDDTGRPVWAFSDGPAGERIGSILFDTFAEGAAHYPGHFFVIR